MQLYIIACFFIFVSLITLVSTCYVSNLGFNSIIYICNYNHRQLKWFLLMINTAYCGLEFYCLS